MAPANEVVAGVQAGCEAFLDFGSVRRRLALVGLSTSVVVVKFH